MKKLLLLLTVTLSINSYSQFKVKAGFNTTFTKGTMETTVFNAYGGKIVNSKINYEDFFKPKSDIYIGIDYEIKGGESDNFNIELTYNKTGGRSNKNLTQNEIIKNFKADYLTAAFLYQYEIFSKLKIGLGPQFNFLVGSNNNYSNSNIKNDFTKNYVSINSDISYYVTNEIILNLRYGWGIDKAGVSTGFSDNNIIYKYENNLKINNLQIGLAYRFSNKSESKKSDLNLADEIKKLNELKESGLITEEEYNQAKRKLLE